MKNKLTTFAMLAMFLVPTLLVGCRGEIDDDGADLELGAIQVEQAEA